ncbi:sensor histidine kinase [Cellulomonas iranensis]|uniref:histidine kinase n=1 Tax=Cellulomonas iranensis TaxID=76862 RepID=A0ABU0GH02_9CELL|nr:HAMP domain-containing sensor histidine kinase [Cellulomonas iranensis]MDQ0424636.1 two-component system OmpR family sensor kinase [Cellulomonas iranensis]
MTGTGPADAPRAPGPQDRDDVVPPDAATGDAGAAGADERAASTPAGARSAVPDAVRRAWRTLSLQRRLVTITAVLLGAGLVVAGVTAATLLERSLLGPVDQKLASEARDVANDALRFLAYGGGTLGPTDYYVRVQTSTQDVPLLSSAAAESYGTPLVDDLSPAAAQAIAGEPFTVGSSRAGSSWRVVAYPFDGGGTSGSVVVGLPLKDIHRTVAAMGVSLTSSGLAIVLLGVVAGGWAVRRSLRPLREIEATAAAIAAGDLSRRVPSAPTSTEVGRLGEALNGMLAQIEEAFAARTASEARMRRFVADASHELRTPLAAIRGYAELYRMGALRTDEQVQDTMRRIEGSATRMGSLVEDLLALARLDEGRQGRLGPVDLTVLAADAVSDLRALDPRRPVRLQTLGGATAPRVVVGDEARLRQVLANLVGNAERHTPAGTPVEVAVGPGDDATTAVLEVRDHGPGIAPEHAARVFERFYRVDASRTRDSGGSGLGMAIVAAIVTSHGGRVAVHETPGGGTTVRVVLPVDGPPSAPAAPEADPQHAGPQDGPPGVPPATDVATMARPSSTS